MSWHLKFGDPSPQGGAELSFVGGRPRLPANCVWPVCIRCGARQTFFFQIAFPPRHSWEGKTLAQFACTSCADEDHLIPKMLEGRLHNADVPEGFLEEYQVNFKCIVFETVAGVLHEGPTPCLKFRPLLPSNRGVGNLMRLGGEPQWLMEDERPATYAGGGAFDFLFQIAEGTVFEPVEGAPCQMDVGMTGLPEPSQDSHYTLFIANEIYYFGHQRTSLVYILTQVRGG